MTLKPRSRWSRFLLISKPFFQSKAGRWGLGLLALLFTLVLVVKSLDIGNNYVYGGLITAATDRKAVSVCHLALLYAGVLAISAMAAALLRFTEERLGLRWRDWLTRYLLDRYLASRAYHRIKEAGQLDNPDQRISEDVKTFTTNALSIVLILVNSTVALLGFAGVLWSITPWLLVGAIGYALIRHLPDRLAGQTLDRPGHAAVQEGSRFPLRIDPRPRTRRRRRSAPGRGTAKRTDGRTAANRPGELADDHRHQS